MPEEKRNPAPGQGSAGNDEKKNPHTMTDEEKRKQREIDDKKKVQSGAR